MSVAMIGLCAGLMSVGAPLERLTVGETDGWQGGFSMSLQASPKALRNMEPHVSGNRVVLFIPGVSGRQRPLRLDEGPVARVEVTARQRGTVVVLTARKSAESLAKRLQLPTREPWALTVGEAKPVSQTSEAPALPRAVPSLLDTAPEAEPGLSPVISAGNSPATRHLKKSSSPKAAGLALGRPDSATGNGTVVISFMGLILALAAGIALWTRRKKAMNPAAEGIELVAMREIGNKQRLALVETCGDRFLLAATDKDVRLLGPVGGARDTAQFSEVLQDLEGERPGTASQDLTGLLRLKRRRETGLAGFVFPDGEEAA